MINAQPGETVRVGADGAPTGLTGTLGVRVMQGTTVVMARVTTGIVEVVAGSGSYEATFIAPGAPGRYRVVFDTGSVSPATVASDDLVVAPAGASVSDTITLGPDVRLPIGTVVSLYQDNERPAGSRTTPIGTVISTATVGSDGRFTFSGLVPGKPYQAYALVAGSNVWTTFTG